MHIKYKKNGKDKERVTWPMPFTDKTDQSARMAWIGWHGGVRSKTESC